MGATRDDRIVVGVDGSDPGRQALMWALDEARRRGVGCLLVHVYEFGLAAASPYAGRAFAQIRDSAQRMLDEDVAFSDRADGADATDHVDADDAGVIP